MWKLKGAVQERMGGGGRVESDVTVYQDVGCKGEQSNKAVADGAVG